MLAHPITQTALLFGLVVASGLLLTLVNDTLTATRRDRARRKDWHRALVTVGLSTATTSATAVPDTAFKVITVKTKPVPTLPATRDDLPKAA